MTYYYKLEQGKMYSLDSFNNLQVWETAECVTRPPLSEIKQEIKETEDKNEEREKNYHHMIELELECDRRIREQNNRLYVCFSMEPAPLDEVFIEGDCLLVHPAGGWNNKKNFKVRMNSPTLWDIVRFANEGIEATEDYHHVFLEGVHRDKKFDEYDLPAYSTSMGS